MTANSPSRPEDLRTPVSEVKRTTSAKVPRRILVDALVEAQRVADPKSTMPVLVCALLEVRDGTLLIAATDLSMSFRGDLVATTSLRLGDEVAMAAMMKTIEAQPRAKAASSAFEDKPGPWPIACVDAKRLLDACKSLPDGDVEVVIEDEHELVELVLASKMRCVDCGHDNDVGADMRTSEERRAKVRTTASEGVAYRCSKQVLNAKGANRACGGATTALWHEVRAKLDVQLRGGKAKFKLQNLHGSRFPKLPDVGADVVFTGLPAGPLRLLLSRALPAVSQDETRPHLNGALLQDLDVGAGVVAPTLRVVATDGHRLHKVQAAMPSVGFGDNFVLPRAALVDFMRYLGALKPLKKGGDVPLAEVAAVRDKARSGIDESTITPRRRLVWRRRDAGSTFSWSADVKEAMFPPYDQVIPRSADLTATVARADLEGAMKRLLVVASQKTLGSRWTPETASIFLSSDDADGNSVEEEIAAEVRPMGWRKVPRKPRVYGLNLNYVADAVEALGCDGVVVGFTDELAPITFKAQADTDEVFVVMPMGL